MQFNVAQQLKEGTGSTRYYDLNEMVVYEEVMGPCPVDGSVAMLCTTHSIVVTAHLRTGTMELCGRCLEPFSQILPLEIQEEYFPTTDVNGGATVPVPEEAGPFTINSRHILDLSEAVRQSAILARPISPLCKPDCLGLCQECGHNLNKGSCGCLGQIDARWAKLEAALLERPEYPQ